MNTIAILPGGRKLCSPPCKNISRPTRHKRQIFARKYSNNILSSKKGVKSNSETIGSLNQNIHSCVSSEQTIKRRIDDTSKMHNIYWMAVIMLNQFEDILELKRSLIRKQGSIID